MVYIHRNQLPERVYFFMYHLVLSTINPNIVFVWIIAQTAPFVFFQLSYCVTDMELISPMGLLVPFAPHALIQHVL